MSGVRWWLVWGLVRFLLEFHAWWVTFSLGEDIIDQNRHLNLQNFFSLKRKNTRYLISAYYIYNYTQKYAFTVIHLICFRCQTSNFELLMLNIKIKLQQKWTKYFHISKFEKSQMDKMNYTWKKIIYIIQHVLYTYVCQYAIKTMMQIILLRIIHCCWMKNIYEIIKKCLSLHNFISFFLISQSCICIKWCWYTEDGRTMTTFYYYSEIINLIYRVIHFQNYHIIF